ncbi:hypothetical protein RQP46_001807 [Phenoliferia psychrophenolica]
MSAHTIATLPAHISTLLVTGAGGYVGREVASLLLARYPTLKLVLTDVRAPEPIGSSESIAADLSEETDVAKLFSGRTIDAILAFHGIMSGGSEAEFDLGYKVNIDAHRVLLNAARKETLTRKDGNKVVYVYTSSQAVYGGDKCLPEAFVDPSVTPLFPESSYGTAKAIVELYVFDYTRKGFVDGRILRLPTVAVRAGLPSSAASSFISGMIREPLMGKPSECPVASSFSDPEMSSVPIYLSRASTVFANIAYALAMPAAKFPSYSRTVNVPGITIVPRQIVEALAEIGGQDAVGLITYKRDPAVIAITSTWPGFLEAVRDFKDSLKA